MKIMPAVLFCLQAVAGMHVYAADSELEFSTRLKTPPPSQSGRSDDAKGTGAVSDAQLSNPAPSALTQQTYIAEYRISSSDLIEITVFQVPELSKTVRVGVSGTITLPLIGLVTADGLTGRELESLIEAKLKEKYLQNPQVSVFIKEYTSQRLTVEGMVAKPGVFPITGKTTLLQAVAMAGGLDKLADESDIKVFRGKPDGTQETIQYDILQIRKGEAKDPLLLANDMVVVGRSDGKATLKSVTETLRDISIFGLFF